MIRLAVFLFTAIFAVTSSPATATGLTVTDSQVRLPMPGRTVTAGYFTIQNNSSAAVQLLSVTTPAFERAELHQHSHQDGVMRMEQVAEIDIAAKSSVSLQPGGLHLMLFNPVQELQAGESITVILHFSHGRQLELSMPLTEMPRR